MNAQVGKLNTDEAHLNGCLCLNSVRTDNGERLLQPCASHKLFLCSMSFHNNCARLYTWRSPSTDQQWSQVDHVAISHRWRGSFTDCRSYWNITVYSDHALLCCRFSIRFSGYRKNSVRCISTEILSDIQVKNEYQECLGKTLPKDRLLDVNSYWNAIYLALQVAGTSAGGAT